MSRKANQATKLLVSHYPIGQTFLASYGWKWPEAKEAFDLVSGWQCGFALLDGAKWSDCGFPKDSPAPSKQQIEAQKQQLAGELIAKLRAAIKTEDGTFFRQLADAIELQNKCNDPLRYWLVNYFAWKGGRSFYSAPPPRKARVTFSQLRRDFERGFSVPREYYPDDRQLRRACREIGVLLKADKRGARRKK